MNKTQTLIGVSAVAIDGRALLIEGGPGSGKSTLALTLIDRGARLIGDDGVRWEYSSGMILLSSPPNIAGKIEIRGVGIVELDVTSAPLSLILTFASETPRLPEAVDTRDWDGVPVPCLPLLKNDPMQALRAEWALRIHGLTF
ncbi:serine kinase [Altererythrobacter sp.]|uniref:HPr kinase/phosphorylase n=1 Tax=Altererythrobacter sp. TaxID=1872480 RepID=UPI001B14D5B6|nr:serine kinase [Altererythrobacter sp.]MBO6608898.1 serine kinase [Altererythrobacter sp.]MBO6640938.1 serine kinase [Altererythrobacter sp.]MBO6708364.1 serine kinase [Altererythrobacter sp.]MBO6945499.1 serine kinase [Altererythrobacter sp.]